MRFHGLALSLTILVLMTSATPAWAEEACSEAKTKAVLKKLDSREKLAADGLRLWQHDLEELRKNAKGASYFSAGLKAAPIIPLVKLGAVAFLLGMDFTIGASVISAGAFATAAVFEAASPHFDREKNPLNRTFRQFDQARAKARAKVKAPKWDFFGAGTAAYSRDLYEEALTMTDLYRQELKFIREARWGMRALMQEAGCTRLMHAINVREAAKVPLDVYQELSPTPPSPQSTRPVAAVPAKH